MESIINIRPELFRARLLREDYRIYRDGVSLMVVNDRDRQGHVLQLPTLTAILQSKGIFANDEMVQYLISGNQSFTFSRLPSDEWIIDYCINQALIPCPHEVYV